MLSTIVELATALGKDQNYDTTILNQINNKGNINDTCAKA